MSNSLRFSIITPSYNQLDWLRLCVASVADQEGVELEHIVQDAGTPGIEELTRRHEATKGGAGSPAHSDAPVVNSPSPPSSRRSTLNARLQIVSEPDAGMYDAINRGLRRATGDVCAWLNCDEQYLPGALAEVAKFFEARPEVEVLFADAILVDRRGRALSYRRAVLPTGTHTRLAHLNTLSCATFFRRSLVQRGLLFDPQWKAIGDAVWVASLIDAGARMACLRRPTSVFTFTGANLGASARAAEEGARWREASNAPTGWLRLPAIAAHRARKLVGGAYLPRRAAFEIYTLRSPKTREARRQRLGFGWPGPAPAQGDSPPAAGGGASRRTAGGIPCREEGERARRPAPKVGAVLTTRDRRETCLTCLDRLVRQTAPLFRIVVVDNASTDGTAEAIESRHGGAASLRVVASRENLGNPEGIAVAMKAALAEGAEAIWILDDDSWPREDALERLLEEAGAPGWVAGSLVLEPESGNPSWPYGIPEKGSLRIAPTLEELPEAESFETRGTWLGALIPAQVIAEAGLPDGRLFLRGEDEEYPARIKEAGYRFLCVRGSVLEHPSPHRLQKIRLFGLHFFYEPNLPLWKAYYMVRNQAYVRRKYRRSGIKGLVAPIGGVGLAIGFALWMDDEKIARVLTYLKAGWHGVTGRLGKRVTPP